MGKDVKGSERGLIWDIIWDLWTAKKGSVQTSVRYQENISQVIQHLDRVLNPAYETERAFR
jgi:hypothetical protein